MPFKKTSLLDGVLGGLLGTALQTLVMWAAQRLHLLGSFPPKRITQKAFARMGKQPKNEPAQVFLTTMLHVGFGVGAGMVFGLIARPVRLPASRLWEGILFGTGMWLVSYFGWVPALKLMPLPQHDHPSTRPLLMLLNHWVYGGTLGAVVAWRQRSRGHSFSSAPPAEG